MGFSLAEQMNCLWWSFICGLMLGVMYDIIKVFRLYVLTSKAAVFICDMFFMVVSAFVSVGFSVGFARGNTRYFIVFGELCGFLLMHFTLGKLIVSLLGWFFLKTGRIFQITIDKIRKITKRVLKDTGYI